MPHNGQPAEPPASSPEPTDALPLPAERLIPEEGRAELPEDVQDFLINVGPHHPGTHGVLRLVTRLDGERVVGLDVRIGYMHRSLEKIAENRSYPQIIAFTDRTADYLAAMHNDWVYCLAAEQLLDIAVPERAEYLRVIVGELNRISSHLMSIGALGLDSGSTTYFLWCFAARERIVQLLEELCGARLTYVYLRLGGVIYDATPDWLARADEVVHGVIEELPRYRALFHENYIWHLRSKV